MKPAPVRTGEIKVPGFKPSVLVVESAPTRRDLMMQTARDSGALVSDLETDRAALNRLRESLPDVLMVGADMKGTGLKDFVSVVHAAYPALPIVCAIKLRATALHLVEEGAFDVVMDGDDPRLWQAALRRSFTDARARVSIREERARLLLAQTRLSALAPAVDEMLDGLAAVIKDAMDSPDISIKKVESVCVRAMSRFLDGATVVTMAAERDGVLRPRACSHPGEAHDHAVEYGFLLTENPQTWKEDLLASPSNEPLVELVRDTYGHRHCMLAVIGPEDEPYGAAAFLTDAANPLMPEERELVVQVTHHAAHCIRVARHFRQVLRRYAMGSGS